MSAKKITQLTQKTSLDNSDKFVIVDSLVGDNKSVTALTIKNYVGGAAGDMLKSVYDTNNNGIVDNAEKLGGQLPSFYLNRSNHTGTQLVSTISDLIEIWNLSQFQSNSSVVLPLGKRVYLRRSDGVITGVYKLGDGVTQLSNLNWMSDKWRVIGNWYSDMLDKHWLVSYNESSSQTFLARNIIPDNSVPNASEISMRGNLCWIPYPITLYSIGLFIPSFSTSGTLQFALYRINSNFSATKITETNQITINSAGLKLATFSSSISLEPGLYGVYFIRVGGQFGHGHYSVNAFNGISFLDRTTKITYFFYAFIGVTTFPTSLTLALNSASGVIYYEFLFDAKYI
jgi:hypothetical protein